MTFKKKKKKQEKQHCARCQLDDFTFKNDNRNRQEVGEGIKQEKALERGHLLTLSSFLEIHIS